MDTTAIVLLLLGLAVGAALGAALVSGRASARGAQLHAAAAANAARAEAAELAQRQLVGQLEGQRGFEGLVGPLRDTLDRVELNMRELERGRAAAQAGLAQQIETLRLTGDALRGETAALVTALRKPQVRGQWGEMHLRRAVELAGMVERCDFDTQLTLTGADGTVRPDLVVHLAGGKHVVVDSKVPLAAFLEAAEAGDEQARAERLAAHARQLRAHVDALSAKAYWQRLDSTPEFVVLFVPGEAFLAQAAETDPTLLEYAASRKIVIATPTTLIALLRAVAYAWNQQALAANAREVFELGREMYSRLSALGDHVDRLGRALGSAVGAFNKTVGSLETRVLVTARRLRDLEVVDAELPTPAPIDVLPRPVSAPELVSGDDELGPGNQRSQGDQRATA